MMGYMGGWDDKKKASVFALHCMVNGMAFVDILIASEGGLFFV